MKIIKYVFLICVIFALVCSTTVFASDYETYNLIVLVEHGRADTQSKPVAEGDTETISFVAEEGYVISKIYVNDKEVASDCIGKTKGSYELTYSSDIEFKVICEKQQFIITTEIENGAIDSSQKVAYGENRTISYRPNAGYKIESIILNKGTNSETKLDVAKYGTSFTFASVKENKSIYVKCVPSVYTITTDVKNGTISASKEVSVGENYTVTFEPREGYILKEVIIDSVYYDVSSIQNSISFKDIRSNHSIYVTFEEQPIIAVALAPEKQKYAINDEIKFTLTLDNQSKVAAKDVSIEVILPDYLEFKSFENNTYVTRTQNGFVVMRSELTSKETYSVICKALKESSDKKIDIKAVSKNAKVEPKITQVAVIKPQLAVNIMLSKNTATTTDKLHVKLYGTNVTNDLTLKSASLGIKLPEGLSIVENSLTSTAVTKQLDKRSLKVTAENVTTQSVLVEFDMIVDAATGVFMLEPTFSVDDTLYSATTKYELNVIPVAVDVEISAVDKAALDDLVSFKINVKTANTEAKNANVVITLPAGLKLDQFSIKRVLTSAKMSIDKNVITLAYDSLTEDTISFDTHVTAAVGMLNTSVSVTADNLMKEVSATTKVEVKEKEATQTQNPKETKQPIDVPFSPTTNEERAARSGWMLSAIGVVLFAAACTAAVAFFYKRKRTQQDE